MFDYIEVFYNRQRLHSGVGYQTPAEARVNMMREVAMAIAASCSDPTPPRSGGKSIRWLSLMVMVPIPWANRRWALPFLTVLAPSKRWSDEHNRRHKTVVDWARLVILQTKRWMPTAI